LAAPSSSPAKPATPQSQHKPPSESISGIAQQAMASFERKRARPPEPAPQPQAAPVESKPVRLTPAPQPAAPSAAASTGPKTYGMDLNAVVANAAAMSSRKGREPESGRLPTRPEPAAQPATPASKIAMPSLDSSGDRLQTILREIEEAARRAEQSRKF